MKKLLFSLALLIATSVTLQAQVGIGTQDPKGALDIVSPDSGVVLPRVVNLTAVNTPVDGTIVYDLSEHCIKIYSNSAWTGCVVTSPVYTVANPTYQGTSVIDATGIGYNAEAVPAASTITVEATVTAIGPYALSARDVATGLEYSASGTFVSIGTQPVVLTHNGTVMPEFFSGVITMDLIADGVDSTLDLKPRIDVKSIPASATTAVDVSYGTQTWMDRNLGARRKATAIDDVFSYGNLYQWGRPADGHEITVINGATLTAGRGLEDPTALEALSSTDTPGHSNFILTNVAPFDWLATQADPDRWATDFQGPCPTGYHVPTNVEWSTADAYDNGAATNGGTSLGLDNNTEAYESDLKLPSTGLRSRNDGNHSQQGVEGYYWSRSTTSITARNFLFASSVARTFSGDRASGYAVRCIKN